MEKKMKINLTNDEIVNIVRMVLDSDYQLASLYREDEDDINSVRMTFYNMQKHDKVYISFRNNHIEVISNDNKSIYLLQKYYLDYISTKFAEIGQKRDEIVTSATKLANKLKFSIINSMYNEGVEEIDSLLKDKDKFTLASAMDYVRCGNHTSFRKIDNPYAKLKRDIKIGQVYVADLNPVVDAEYGGKRNVVVVGYNNDRTNFVVVPCTTNADNGMNIGFMTEKANYAVANKIKIVSPMRLFEFKGVISKQNLEKLKEAVLSSYALFEEKQFNEEFKTKISYKNSVENTQTLDGLSVLFPIRNPSEKVLVKIINGYYRHLESIDGIKRGEVQEGDYYTNTSFKNNTIITILNGKSGQQEVEKYDFSNFCVKRLNEEFKWKYDRDLTSYYQKDMLKYVKSYYIHLLKYLCNLENMFYRKENLVETSEEEEEYLIRHSKILKDKFNELGFIYSGKFEELILDGSKAFKMSEFKRQEPIQDEDDKLIESLDSDKALEELDEDENE